MRHCGDGTTRFRRTDAGTRGRGERSRSRGGLPPRLLALSPGRLVAGRRSIVAAGIAVLMAGCAPPGAPRLEPGQVPAREMLSRLSARVDTVRTVEASGRILVTQGGARFEARHRMLYRRPELLRIEVESRPLFGLFEARMIALADGESLHVYSPTHGILFEASGADDLDFLGPEMKWVAMAGIRDALLGLPQLDGRRVRAENVRPGKGGTYEISVDEGLNTRTFWVDPESLIVERMEIRDKEGGLLVSSDYEYRGGDRLAPNRVRIRYPANDATISLTYAEYNVNGDVDPADFEMVVPADVRRYRPHD
jgi:outer membrane lipoprotein-sorting protein